MKCKPCGANWFYYNQHCYLLNNQTMTQTNAETWCENKNSVLASINDMTELEFITKLAINYSGPYIWV
jgi:hypothetical protein